MKNSNVNYPVTWGVFVFLFAFGITPGAISAPFTIEFYSNQADFESRLGATNIVDFESIDTSSENSGAFDPTPFDSDLFKMSDGITITGEGGQFASQNFIYSPSDWTAVSGVNMYAPGPVVDQFAPNPAGGNQTTVEFFDGGTPALTAGFGLYFIDPDFPDFQASGFSAFGMDGAELGNTGTVVGQNAEAVFAGLIAIDTLTDTPIPLFSKILITNGSGWPANDNNEGVTLDDFIFGTPVAAPNPVPVPAAIWLFGTALIGLVGIRKRRKIA